MNERMQAEQLSHCGTGLLGYGFVPDYKAIVPLCVDDVAHRRMSRNLLHARGLGPVNKLLCASNMNVM